MHRKLVVAAAGTAAIMTVALGPAAYAAPAHPALGGRGVSCGAAALAAAVSSAYPGETLFLSPGCVYKLDDTIHVGKDLTIVGVGATLERASDSDSFSLIQVDTRGDLTVLYTNFRDGGGSGDPVDGQAGIALELSQRPHGVVAQDAVHPAGVEAQCAQALLQLGHVVTPQHRGPAVEEAVTQPETGFHQGVPCLDAADPVHPEAAQALEGLERGAGGGTEDPVSVDRRPGEDGGQAVLDVGDRVAALADGEGQAYR